MLYFPTPLPLYRVLIYTLTFPHPLFYPPHKRNQKILRGEQRQNPPYSPNLQAYTKVVLKEKLVADIKKEEKDHNKDNFTSCRTKDTHTVYYQSIIQTPKVVLREKPKPVEGRKW